MSIVLKRSVNGGLVSFDICLNGQCLYSFLSEQRAKVRYLQLKHKLIAR